MKTKVLFRKFQGEILALLPAEASTVGNPSYCMCYAHCGQHSGADLHGVIQDSRPAKPEEYSSLARELERIGYELDIRKRTTRTDYNARLTQLK